MDIVGRSVRVTVTVEVIDVGSVQSVVTDSRVEGCGNPLFTTRVAHRLTEEISDSQRAMLGAKFGEIDPEWKSA